TGERIVKTAADQVAVIGTLRSGATASIHIREAVAGGIGFQWEINGTDGTLRITADAALPEIFPLTVHGAHGRSALAELDIPIVVTQKSPALAKLEGTPAFNVGRAYAAFAADLDNGTHTLHGVVNGAGKLDVDEIDLLIRHHALPSAFDRTLEAYRALETLLADGEDRAIVVSNFMVEHLAMLHDRRKVVPAVNQIGVHP